MNAYRDRLKPQVGLERIEVFVPTPDVQMIRDVATSLCDAAGLKPRAMRRAPRDAYLDALHTADVAPYKPPPTTTRGAIWDNALIVHHMKWPEYRDLVLRISQEEADRIRDEPV